MTRTRRLSRVIWSDHNDEECEVRVPVTNWIVGGSWTEGGVHSDGLIMGPIKTDVTGVCPEH